MIVPPGLKLGANRRLAGEDIRAGSGGAPRRPAAAPQHVALAAASQLTALAGAAARARRAVLHRRRDRRAGHAAAGGRALRFQPRLLAAMLARLAAEVTDLGILPDDPADARARARGGGARTTTWC